MTPERMAVVRREIDLLPRGKAAIAYARTRGARLVAEQIASSRVAGHLSALGLGIEITDEITDYFAAVVRQSATILRLQMQEAAEMIAYDIAAHLDARAPSALIRAIADRAAGPLSPAQVDAIVARETAWWVRLHVHLDERQSGDRQLDGPQRPGKSQLGLRPNKSQPDQPHLGRAV